MTTSLVRTLESTFKDLRVDPLDDERLAVSAPSESVPAILRFLKDEGFEHLALVSCVDWIELGELEVVYILTSYICDETDAKDEQKTHVLLKARIPRAGPVMKSATAIFENAEPYERELHELYGVHFEGHQRLIPLLLEREYEIPPFRKDFDTRKYVEETFGSIPQVEGG